MRGSHQIASHGDAADGIAAARMARKPSRSIDERPSKATALRRWSTNARSGDRVIR
jgi:hypothetical protein